MPRRALSQTFAGTSLFALVACNAILGNKERPLALQGSGGESETAGTNSSSQAGSTGKSGHSGGSSGVSGDAAGGDIDESAGEDAGAAAGMSSGGASGSLGSGGKAGTTGSGGTLSGGASGSVGSGGKAGSVGSGGTPSGGASGSVGSGGKAGSVGSGGKSAGGAAGTSGASTAGNGTGGTTSSGGAGGTTSTGGITVKLDATRQTIQGFGISTALMPTSKTIPVDKLFGTDMTDSIGLTILRVGMNPTGTLTGSFVSEAKAKGAKIIGTVWSPPANCKTNGKTTQGGALVDTTPCFSSWSTTIVNFAKAQGLYAMSIANGPDFASCASVGPPCTDDYDTTTYTAKQMVAWVKTIGPALKAQNIKVIAPEVTEWIHAWSNASATGSTVAAHPQSSDPLKCGCFSNSPTATGCAQTCLDGNGYDYGHWLWKDPAAWQAFDIFGVQEYDSQIAFAWPADVNAGKRDKEVWQTEMSGLKYWPEEGPSTDINNGVAVAGWIHSALTVGEASAWLWSWYESYFLDDNEGLALVKGGSTVAKRYFTLGNYSKFCRPGYLAVDVAGNADANLLLSACKSQTDGTVVVVAVNKGTAAATVPIAISGGTAPSSMTPNVTSATDNLKAGTAVSVTGGSFMAALPGKSVTTFVGK